VPACLVRPGPHPHRRPGLQHLGRRGEHAAPRCPWGMV